MGFGIESRARSRKARSGIRSLLGKPPDAKEIGDRLVRLARRMFKDHVIDATPRRVTLNLHPSASPVRLLVTGEGELEIAAETSTVGPGYHHDVIVRLTQLLDELEFVWCEAPRPRAALQGWLAGELARGVTRIAMPAQREFKIDAAVLTAMGPRDRAWVDAVIADPARGADAFAWWDDGAGHRERSRALLAMWHEVPWREPVDDAERTLMERVDADLEAAWRANPALELPWAEWAELRSCLGIDVGTELSRRAADREPTIGYRRHVMEVELLGGWSIELGGAFVGHWEDADARWWATDGDRVIELTSLTADDETDSARLLAVAPERHPVIERFEDAGRCGRAEAYDEDGLRILIGIVTAAPNVAIMTCKSTRPDDDAWALATWRSLRCQ